MRIEEISGKESRDWIPVTLHGKEATHAVSGPLHRGGLCLLLIAQWCETHPASLAHGSASATKRIMARVLMARDRAPPLEDQASIVPDVLKFTVELDTRRYLAHTIIEKSRARY